MSEYETKMLDLLKQIADDVRWIRTHEEELEAARAEADEQLQEQLKKGYPYP
jgi:hypothetical protein